LPGRTAALGLFLRLFVFLFLVLDHPPHQLFPMVFDVALILFEFIEDAFVSFPDFKQRMSGTTRAPLGIVHFLVLAFDSLKIKKAATSSRDGAASTSPAGGAIKNCFRRYLDKSTEKDK
jgi:hypothetical protein